MTIPLAGLYIFIFCWEFKVLDQLIELTDIACEANGYTSRIVLLSIFS
jgi:hypothetical protein